MKIFVGLDRIQQRLLAEVVAVCWVFTGHCSISVWHSNKKHKYNTKDVLVTMWPQSENSLWMTRSDDTNTTPWPLHTSTGCAILVRKHNETPPLPLSSEEANVEMKNLVFSMPISAQPNIFSWMLLLVYFAIFYLYLVAMFGWYVLSLGHSGVCFSILYLFL